MPPSITLLKSSLSASGGLEKYTWRLIDTFRRQGCPITLLTTTPPHLIALKEDPSLKIISHPLSCKLSFRKVQKFDNICLEHCKKHSPSVVFGMDRNSFQTHLRAGNGVHKAYLEHRRHSDGIFKRATYCLNPLHRTLLSLEKTSFEHPDLRVLITNSSMVKNEILSFYRTDPKKIHVVHNGVEWKEMQQDFELWPQRRKEIALAHHLDPGCFHFLFVGHHYRRKGLENLLRALPLLKDKNVHLSVVGKEKNLSHFQSLTAALNLQKQVSFFGSQKDLRPFYQLADALVIPSFYDPFANVTVEALAMGLFVVSSKTNGGHEVINGSNGAYPNGAVIDNLYDRESIAIALEAALKSPKTWERSLAIRHSVESLDFSKQLLSITKRCL